MEKGGPNAAKELLPLLYRDIYPRLPVASIDDFGRAAAVAAAEIFDANGLGN